MGPGNLTFHFGDDGALRSVSSTFSQPSTTVISGTIELVETDRAKIEEDMDRFGVMPELVQLYAELERVQGQEYVHLITEIKDETDYPGYDSARQEFIRCGSHYYRNYKNQNSQGSWVVTALKFGGVIQVRQYSDDGIVPNMNWSRDDSREYDNIALLKADWTELEVSDIRREEDGSTVITLQKDLAEVSGGNSTVYSMTHDFCLDPRGKLVSLTYSDYSRVIREDSFATGVFEGPYQAVTYILDTPAEELQERIQAVRDEIVNKKPRA